MDCIHPDLLELKDPDDLLEDEFERLVPARFHHLVEDLVPRNRKRDTQEWF